MDELAKIFGVLFAGVLVFLGITLLMPVLGAVVGWSVGLLFGETILGIFAAMGITGFKMWQIGAFLGFVSGFFKQVAKVGS